MNSVDLQAQSILRAAEIPRAHAAAKRIRDETRALLRMITNLLDISKADEGRLAPALGTVDARALVGDVATELGARADASDVKIATNVHIDEIDVDRDLIARVLANLIDNAIHHAPEGSQVHVRMAPTSGGVELRVSDAGPGVPENERERVFERFLSGATASRSNRGLGLAFCKVAVEAHGGRIWIEDARPGAVFCVVLPQHRT